MEDPEQKPLLLDFAKQMPKVELHAHLHGCVRPETLLDLAAARGFKMAPEQQRALRPGGDRSLSDCFKIFDVIHSVVSDLAAVRRITLETLQDMRGHNVRYVELRTTPRVLADGTSRQDYIEAVLRVLRDFETAGNTSETRDELSRGEGSSGLIPRLLLSIDRGRTVDDAMVVAKLAVKLRRNELWGAYVVGVDFSGNPTKGAFEDFRPALELARSGGLKVTAHCGEVPNDSEFSAVVRFRPDRLGHAVVLGEEAREALLSARPPIPIEVCPTSNLLTLALSDHREHPTVRSWIEEGYPFSVNTDDPGVFDTDLPAEFVHAAASNGMDEESMARLACRAVQDIFDEALIPSLSESFRRECEALLRRP
ncbi:unnamed protein product [Ascophyllum nodosum]